MDEFLAAVERRALVMAELATRDREEALDLVQDAMMAFADHYGSRPRADWAPLFHRVLQNRIRDWHRRRYARSRWWGRLNQAREDPETGQSDPIQAVADPADPRPERLLMAHQSRQAIVAAVQALPLRQQQAFVLRVWEGLDVAETARAMGCTAGSVKTHLSRALAALRRRLGEGEKEGESPAKGKAHREGGA